MGVVRAYEEGCDGWTREQKEKGEVDLAPLVHSVPDLALSVPLCRAHSDRQVDPCARGQRRYAPLRQRPDPCSWACVAPISANRVGDSVIHPRNVLDEWTMTSR